MKKLLIVIFCTCIISLPVYAHTAKLRAVILSDFDENNNLPVAAFKLSEPLLLDDFKELPAESIVNLNVFDVRSEKRFHKSGYFRGCLINYQIPAETEVYILEGEQVCFLGKKYQAIDKVDAAVNTAEFAAATTAGFMIPGSDIIYYFTKGAIQNKKGPNRLKSGVINAYDNSIFWVIKKGEPINLKNGDEVILRRYYNET